MFLEDSLNASGRREGLVLWLKLSNIIAVHAGNIPVGGSHTMEVGRGAHLTVSPAEVFSPSAKPLRMTNSV